MNLKIGTSNKGQVIMRSKNVNNCHIFASGKSGCGKTHALLHYILQEASQENVSIVFNWHNCLNLETLSPDIKDEYKKYVTVIDVSQDGIMLPLFTPQLIANNKVESSEAVIQRVTSMLTIAGKLTPTQSGMVYEAAKDIIENNYYKESGIAVLGDWLSSQERAVAHNAAGKLRGICGNNVFRSGDFWDSTSRIYEFDLNGLEPDTQLLVMRFLLEYFARLANKGKFLKAGVNLFIDEVQNFEFTAESTLTMLINEGRKLNIRLLMACPSFLNSAKKGMEILTQCGTCLYFEPLETDRSKIAKFIDYSDAKMWTYALTRLKHGEYIATGCFAVGDKERKGAIIMKPIEF